MRNVNTLRALIENSEQLYGDNSAFVLKNEKGELYNVSYKAFLKDIDSLGFGIYSMKERKNIKVALCSKNCYEWCVTYFAVASGDGVIVPVDKDLSSEQIKRIFDFAAIDIVVCDEECCKKVMEFYDEAQNKPVIICTKNTENSIVHSFENIKVKGEELKMMSLSSYVSEGRDENDLAVLLFTSGTTSVPKGVMLSGKNICSDLKNVCRCVSITQHDVSLSVLPLHHTYEAIAFLMIIYRGGTITFCQGLRYLKQNFLEYKPTVFVTVPLILEKLHKRITEEMENEGKRSKVKVLSLMSGIISEEKRKKIFEKIHMNFGGRLRKIIVGAAELKSETAEDFELFGIPVIFGYGLTECSPIVICNGDEDRKRGSIGKPLDEVQVKIINKDKDGIGEICVKGPMVMLGYYNNQAATDEVLIDGFLHTGDLGFCDDKGYYYITGRSKNVIVTSTGKNIYPEEIESYFNASDLVSEVVVSSCGDIITAQIYPDISIMEKKLKRRNLSDSDIKKLLNEVVRAVNKKLPSYKRVKKLVVRKEDFAKTTTHKIKRYDEKGADT